MSSLAGTNWTIIGGKASTKSEALNGDGLPSFGDGGPDGPTSSDGGGSGGVAMTARACSRQVPTSSSGRLLTKLMRSMAV